ncbi:MAG: lipoprotein-releasing ABC transporter permease subunit [Cocleimonas sp.]
MFKPLSTFIGLRYTKAKRDNHFISFISLASVIGIALGITVLITVLSIMNGYIQGVQDRHLGMLSHVTVTDSDWQLPNWQQKQAQILKQQYVRATAPFVEKQVMLKQADKVHAALIEGVLPESEKNIGTLNRYISNPAGLNVLKAGEFKVILGEKLAKYLDVVVGDSVTLLSPKKQSYIISNDGSQSAQNPDDLIPILKEFEVAATFKVDMQTYDSNFAYIHLDDAAELFELNKDVTGIRVQLDDLFKANEVSKTIAKISDGDFLITNWTTQYSTFFKVLQLQKTMLFMILLLIIVVAAFNLISTLVMVVTDKESDIAILKTLGMSPAKVMRIFIVQGGLLTLIGIVIGVLLGVLIASNITEIVQWIEGLLGKTFLNAEIHGITHIDAKIEWLDVFLIALSTFILAVLATVYPAWKASKIHPAEALRYE